MLTATLVTGLVGAGKSRLIEVWRGALPGAARWAVLRDQGETFKLPRASGASGGDSDPALESMGGCACCTGRLSVRNALGRLLRRGPWEHLLIELSGTGHPAALIDMLRTGELLRAVRLTGVVAVLDAARLEERLAGPHAPWLREQIECADRVVLRHPLPLAQPERLALADRVRALQPFDLEIEHWWGPPVGAPAACVDGGPLTPRLPPVATVWPAEGHLAAVLDEPPSGTADADEPRQSALQPAPGWLWRAAPEQVFDRVRIADTLSGFRARWPDRRLNAVFRTEREWYRWRDGQPEPCVWRRDSRLMLQGSSMGDGADRAALVEALLACRLA